MNSRNYGVDILRIVSIIMITAFHIIIPGMGQYTFYNGTLSIKILCAICSCGVNCFLLISGYANYNSDYKISRIIRILFEALFYNIILTIIVCLINNSLSISRILNSFLIIGNGNWWFLNSYLILFILIPFINVAIKNLTKKKLTMLLFLLLFLTSLYVTIFGDIFYLGNGYTPFWFAIMYTIGAYICKYENDFKFNKLLLIIILIISLIITISSFYFLYKYNGIHLNSYISEETLFQYTAPTILINSIILLLLFKDIKVNNTFVKIIKFITPSIFSVYLIQCQHYIYAYYFPDVFSFLNIYNNKLLIYIPLFAIFISIVCILIDKVRIVIFKLFKIDKFLLFIDSKVNSLI